MITLNSCRLRLTGLGVIALVCSAQAQRAWSNESEDSPLYAASREQAFVDMAARDQMPMGLQTNRPVVQAGAIVVVEGAKWHTLTPMGRGEHPVPMDFTTGQTCYITCFPTRYGQATCLVPTCMGTCNQTCGGTPTCYDTCSLSSCSRPLIFDVTIPQPGQIRFAFSAVGGMQVPPPPVVYHVECCTNLASAQWQSVFSVPASLGNTITFTHTNSAPRAFYRLSIQNQ